MIVQPQPAYAETTAKSARIVTEYVPPKNPAHQGLHDLLKEKGALEKLQTIFSPFKLPVDLKLRTVGCDGVSNAWYHRPDVSVCYEYLDEIQQRMPKETTEAGTTPDDAVLGQFFYVFAHEFGHAVFDLFDVPLMGRQEDAADNFAAYLMLQFGSDQSPRLVGGAAYAYASYVKGNSITAPLVAYSDVHSAPPQRYFNLICIAFGADAKEYAFVVEKDHLPATRARGCKHEYGELHFAFDKLFAPHLDDKLAKEAWTKTWLPPEKPRPTWMVK
jgi:hypothetical protein